MEFINHMAGGAIISSFFHYNSNWNIILLVIGGCSFLSFTIFIERLLFLNKSEVDTNSFMMEVKKEIKDGNLVQAIQVCEKSTGAIPSIVKSGIERHNGSKDQIEGAMQIAGLVEISRLERNSKILSIIAHIAPLIGLLGTVLGFIQAFSEMRLSGLVDISATRIGEALEYALVTTAAGLVVAIPSTVAYNYIVSRIERTVLEMNITTSEVIDLLLGDVDPFAIHH